MGIENPDQRIAEDLRAFIGDGVAGVRGILFLGIDLLSNVVSLVSFIAILWSLSGPLEVLGVSIPGYMVWVALIYAVVGTVATHYVGRPLALLNFAKQRVEADFRFSLVRLRENTEGVALYGGEDEEKRGLLVRFEALAANWWLLMHRYKLLTALTAGYGQVASVFPIVVAAPRYFAGLVPLGALTQTAGAFGQVQGAMSWFVDSYTDIASWRATVERLSTFHRAIEAARAAAGEGVHLGAPAGAGYALEDATLGLPGGEALLENADLALLPGESVVVPAGRGRASPRCSARSRASGRSGAAWCAGRRGAACSCRSGRISRSARCAMRSATPHRPRRIPRPRCARRWMRWGWAGWPGGSMRRRTGASACPAASSSGWRWRARCWRGRTGCSSTRPPPAWTPRPRRRCTVCCASGCPVRPSSRSRTARRWRISTSGTWCSSAGRRGRGGSWRRRRRWPDGVGPAGKDGQGGALAWHYRAIRASARRCCPQPALRSWQ